jgi:fructose-specific component phosphotransferase system IIB-like protein
MIYTVERSRDGGLVLTNGDQEFDLVFTNGAIVPQDPMYAKQRVFLENIAHILNSSEISSS